MPEAPTLRGPALAPGLSLPFFRLPGLCAVCHGWTRGRLCSPCITRYSPRVPRCDRCALQVPAGVARCGRCHAEATPTAARTIAATDYRFPWDGLISGFKFHQGLDLAPALAALLCQASSNDTPDLLLPMPLSGQRLQDRGYNQAWELARRVGRWRGMPARADVLLRIRDTPQQPGLTLAQRATNVRGAFLVEPRARHHVAGRTVALVDDVMTSGASAGEAARALLTAGAKAVHVWVVARTPAPA